MSGNCPFLWSGDDKHQHACSRRSPVHALHICRCGGTLEYPTRRWDLMDIGQWGDLTAVRKWRYMRCAHRSHRLRLPCWRRWGQDLMCPHHDPSLGHRCEGGS